MISNFVKKAKAVQERMEQEEIEDERGANWEDKDNVKYCRNCDSKFEFAPMPPVKRLWKHHCRECGGVVCENCLVDGAIKLCLGCVRGETPGERIQLEVQRLLESDIMRRRNYSEGPRDSKTIIKSKIGNVKNAISIAKDGTPTQQSLSIPGIPAARRVILQRGYLYGENGTKLPAGGAFALSGYFELANKSEDFVCVKLLLPGGDTVFESSRPSYIVVPPGGAVYSLLDSCCLEEVDLLLLINNNELMDPNAPVRYDTTARGADKSKMSPCAAVANFRTLLLVKIQCKDKNILLKYKGQGVVLPRHGGHVGRVGLMGRIQGKRFAEDVLDYSTNVTWVDTTVLVS
mmetsp:Transcript_16067/g.24217  ORF Transcript_16067/g.24217 Transcript_16067/m.24217 type:complete len:346 (-) Transcript_16067:172-1209(-)